MLLSPDEKTLYVAEGEPKASQVRELRAYPVNADGSVGSYRLMHSFGSDHRGPHRGIEGMCLDAKGNVVAVGGWRKSGPGPLVHVFAPSGAVIATHELPGDMPNRCCFGGTAHDTLYVTTAAGELYAAKAG